MEVRRYRSMHKLSQNVDHIRNVGSSVGEIHAFVKNFC